MNLGKRSAALIATGMAGALALSGCGGADGGGGGDGDGGASGQIVYGESTDFPDNLFQLIAAGNATSVANISIRIFPSAFKLLPDFSVVYDDELLTEEPTLEEVEGKQVNVYSINPDAVWSDGTPITADDFEFTWRLQRSAHPADGGCESLLSTVGFERIESVDGADEGKTVTVTYGSAFADWQGLFTGTTPLLPAHLSWTTTTRLRSAR